MLHYIYMQISRLFLSFLEKTVPDFCLSSKRPQASPESTTSKISTSWSIKSLFTEVACQWITWPSHPVWMQKLQELEELQHNFWGKNKLLGLNQVEPSLMGGKNQVGDYNQFKLDPIGRKSKVSGGLNKINSMARWILHLKITGDNAAATQSMVEEEQYRLRSNQNMIHWRNQVGRLELNQSKYTASLSRVRRSQLQCQLYLVSRV